MASSILEEPACDAYQSDEESSAPVTLIVCVKDLEGRVILGADGMAYHSNGSSPCNVHKLYPVNGYKWIYAFSGYAGGELLYKRLDAEIKDAGGSPFDSRIEVGGMDYLRRLRELARQEGINNTDVMLAGFDVNDTPLVLGGTLPSPPAPLVYPGALGAQTCTARWIIRTLGACCRTTEDFKHLVYFAIWQTANADRRIGNPELGYVISLGILESGHDPTLEELTWDDLEEEMHKWLSGLQSAFGASLFEIRKHN